MLLGCEGRKNLVGARFCKHLGGTTRKGIHLVAQGRSVTRRGVGDSSALGILCFMKLLRRPGPGDTGGISSCTFGRASPSPFYRREYPLGQSRRSGADKLSWDAQMEGQMGTMGNHVRSCMAGFGLQCFYPSSEHLMICMVNLGEADSHTACKFPIGYFTGSVKALSFMEKLYCDRGSRRKLALRVNMTSA